MDWSKITPYKTPIIIATLVASIGTSVAVNQYYRPFGGEIIVQPQTLEQVKELKIKGNRNSRIYHLKGCPNYDDISERNVVWFKTKEEAEGAGFRMARNC